MKKYHLFLPLLGILLLVSGGCSKRKEPKPLITEAPAVETEIGGYITETESSTPESQSVSGTIRLPIQEPEHQNESSTESEVVSASIYIGSNGSFRAYPYAGGDIVTPESLIAAMADLTGWNLDLAESVTGENENSLTVCFARSCSLFTGTASAEKEAFPIYSKDQLYRQILDSICYTLQVNFSQDPYRTGRSWHHCSFRRTLPALPFFLGSVCISHNFQTKNTISSHIKHTILIKY